MILNCPVAHAHIETALGAVKVLPFRLKRARTQANLDVSSATSAIFESAMSGEDPMAPIYALPTDPGADWANGLVPVTLTAADVTARPGTYDFWLTMVMPTGDRPVVKGVIEVLPRAIFNPFPLPGGGVYATKAVFRGYNSSPTVTIKRGMLVTRLGAGNIGLAIGADPYRRADGVALAEILPLSSGLFFSEGVLSLPDWTDVLGVTSLSPGTSYYLDQVAGRITATVPTSPGWKLLQLVGEADTAALLDIELDAYEVEL